MRAVVVISPAIMAKPVVTRVSQATRAYLSWARMASRIASEIWSATLSGCPSVTDSEVNKKDLAILLGSLTKKIAAHAGDPGAKPRHFNYGWRKLPKVFRR